MRTTRTKYINDNMLIKMVSIRNKYLHIVVLLFFVLSIQAQWRIGLIGGASYNVYSIDTHYMEGWHYGPQWGGTAGVMGQYAIKDWIAIRAELNWTMKNHRQYQEVNYDGDCGVVTSFNTYNHYMQLPIMVSFSYENRRIRSFANLGGYGAYWCASQLSGFYRIQGLSLGKKKMDYENYDFNSERDCRIEGGFTGGVGGEWHLCQKRNFWKNLSVQVEGRVYYSLTSSQKDYMRIKDPRYNTTYTLQATLCYDF